jgi:predicted ATP-dependent Lon-type protease
VVRKDLTKLIKEGANVPVYVLEYLLGMYCASTTRRSSRTGWKTVKTILAENYVRPDEAEKVKSKIRERGSYKVIDKVTVKLNEKRDVYEALLSNLGSRASRSRDRYVKQYEKLLAGASGASSRCSISSRKARRARPSSSGPEADPDAQHGHGGAVRGARPSPRSSGSTCCCAPPAWSPRTSTSG